MNIKIISLAALIATQTACVAHRKTARLEPAAPALAATLASLSIEPLGCPVYGGDDRPDYDAQALDCLVKWMGEAREYLANGGKPTKYTSPESYESNRATAQRLGVRVSKWLEKTRFNAAAAPAGSAKPVRTPSTLNASLESQQRYLNGIILFQKGDNEGARREWLLAKQFDPANADAQAGLERLDKVR
jgi:hypothetical protein